MKIEKTGISLLDNKAYKLSIDNGILTSFDQIEQKNDMEYFFPGLIDVQVNGNLGIDFSDSNLDAQGVKKVCQSLIEKGTFQFFPTIVTRPENVIERNLEVIAKCVEEDPEVANSITGIHVEGPYISGIDGPRGAHDKNFVRDPSIEELDKWIEKSHGLLKIVTLAPEREGSIEFIKYAASKGIICSIGHTAANGDQIDAAIEAGALAATHLGNGSAAMLDRLRNQIWAQLANDKLNITFIGDGSHLPERVVKVFNKCVDEDKLVMITDLAPIAGMKKGFMKWGSMEVEIVEDGSVHLAGTPYLAAAGSPLIRNVGNFVKFTGSTLQKAVKICTVNPTKVYGLDMERMQFTVGKPVEMVFIRWNADESKTEISEVYPRVVQK